VTTPDDDAVAAARQAASALHDRALRLGYNVELSVGTESPARIRFLLRRVDQESDTADSFETDEDVKNHMIAIEAFSSVYCLELVANPRIIFIPDESSDGNLTWIVDMETNRRFGIRTADLETLMRLTRLCIYTESPPSVGNWERCRY
jgi:hypothetical protein